MIKSNLWAATTILAVAWMSGCGDDDGHVQADAPPADASPADASPADAPGADSGPACPAPTGPGTEHQGLIATDETWTYADSPHIVTSDVNVQGATLTIEPCAEVRLRKGFFIVIGGTTDPAAIVAHGDATRRIQFTRDVAAEPWGSILAYDTGTIDLEHVDLSGGGDPDTAQNNGGTLIAVGPGGNTGLTPVLHVVDVSVVGSNGFGVNVQGRAAFAGDSSDLTVHGAASNPIYVDAPALGTIPAGVYTGNGSDEILVGGAGSLIDASITFRARGVPYRMQTGFSMAPPLAGGPFSTLTIEAGVVIRFVKDSSVWSMDLGLSSGPSAGEIWPVRLVAAGTAAAPIVLTSAEATPAAGDWAGVKYAGAPPTGNVMDHVRIEYAGGNSGTVAFGCGPIDNDAALIITNWHPEEAFITNSTFSDSAAGGIVSGWSSDAAGPDFSVGNTFTNIGNGCDVSRWADGDGSCPSTPPLCL